MKILLKFSIALFIVYVIFGLMLFSFQNQLLLPASRVDFYDCEKFSQAEKIDDSFRGYLSERSESLIVYYHGNGGRACDRYYMDDFFSKMNYSTLFVEYPGYAEDKDSDIAKVLKTAGNVDDFLKTSKFKKVIIVGESIGTGPASYHSSIAGDYLQQVILITPFSSLRDIVSWHYPIYPVSLLLKHDLTISMWLSKVHVPVTLILAGKDEVVGYENGVELFNDLAGLDLYKFEIADAGHNTIFNYEELYQILSNRLQN